ncbi:unnamed protein product, partial [Ceratitis capitata]
MSMPRASSSNNCDGYNTDVMIEADDERDLTSLTWLMELRNQSFCWPNVMQLVTSDDDVITNYTSNSNKQQDSNNSSFMEHKNNFTNIYNNIDKTFVAKGYMVKSSCNKIITHECDKQQNVGSNNNECTSKISKRSWIGNNKYIEKTFKKPTINLKTNPQKVQMKRATPTERFEMFLEKIKRVLAEYKKTALNYQTDTTVKPPFNYSHIIGMVMLENGRVTLQQICSWIENKFAFFRVRKKWN